MKKLIFLLTLLIPVILTSQPCLPEGITFTTQAQIDSFQINYPGCTEIEGSVEIVGIGMTNLLGLNSINVIRGDLMIATADSLTDLEGLENLERIDGTLRIGISIHGSVNNLALLNLDGLRGLKSVGENLYVSGNNVLVNLYGLSNLDSIGNSFDIYNNPNLLNLEGISNLTFVGESLLVQMNSSLKNLEGINKLTFVGGTLVIEMNHSIKNLEGLNNLTTVGNLLEISKNESLESLNGLEELDRIGGDLIIGGWAGAWYYENEILNDITAISDVSHIGGSLRIELNKNLSQCAIQSVCSYLENPNGYASIFGNGVGCNSYEEVLDSCLVGMSEKYDLLLLNIKPNPFTSSTTIEYKLKQPEKVTLKIYDYLGKQVYQTLENQPQGKQQIIWNAEGLPDGIYYYRLQVGDEVANGKMVKVR